jgi:hypothetical protein
VLFILQQNSKKTEFAVCLWRLISKLRPEYNSKSGEGVNTRQSVINVAVDTVDTGRLIIAIRGRFGAIKRVCSLDVTFQIFDRKVQV